MSLSVNHRQEIIPADDVCSDLADLVEIPVDQLRLIARVTGPDGRELPLPSKLGELLEAAMRSLLRGKAVAIVPVELDVAIPEAADFLNVSRQYLDGLLVRGELPFTGAGARRRIKFGDLARYRERRDAESHQALRELTQLSEELGLYDGPSASE